MRRPIVAIGLVVLVCLAGSGSADVPPWMNYQGVLMDSGGNAVPDGTYDVTFRIYDEAMGVTALWEETQSLLVTDAILNAHLGSVSSLSVLDFEVPYWLGISIDGDPEMTPRTAFTTVPYAVHSVYADTGGEDWDWVIDGDNVYHLPGRVGIGTDDPGAKLHVLTGDEIAGDFSNWSTTGNAVIRARNTGGTAGEFYSTMDYLADIPTGAVLGFGGPEAIGGYFRSDVSGDALVGEAFGLGTAVVGTSWGDGYSGFFTGGPGVRIEGQAHVDAFRMDSGAVDGYVLTTDGSGFATWGPGGGGGGPDGDWDIVGTHMFSAVPGSLGIGTTTMRAKMNVGGTGGPAVYTRSYDGGGYVFLSPSDASLHAGNLGGVAISASSDTVAVYGLDQATDAFGMLGANGRGAYGEASWGAYGYLGGPRGVYGEGGNGNYGYLGSNDYGAYGEYDFSGCYGALGTQYNGAYGYSSTGSGAYGLTDTGYGVTGYAIDGTGVQGFNLGSGSTGYLGGDTWAVYGYSTSQTGVKGESNAGVGVHGTSVNNIGVYGSSTNDYAAYFDGDVNVVNGRIITPIIEITGGSDLSEQFETRAAPGGTAPEPGMLVSIDPASPGDLVVSSAPYDPRVAGVVSGAGGVATGMLMGQEGTAADGETSVALTGRVYCWADASNGPIGPGDLLTTSATPGHAMRATDRGRSHGAVIGKAMGSLESGTGLVLVLVNLQ